MFANSKTQVCAANYYARAPKLPTESSKVEATRTRPSPKQTRIPSMNQAAVSKPYTLTLAADLKLVLSGPQALGRSRNGNRPPLLFRFARPPPPVLAPERCSPERSLYWDLLDRDLQQPIRDCTSHFERC